MYYRLKDNYILRGWDKLPYALVNTETGQASFLNYQEFKAIEYCNGNIDFSLPFISSIVKSIIHKAERDKIIEPCEKDHSITPNQEYKRYSSPYVRTAHWSITGKCNYKCRHCYLSSPDVNSHELSHEDIMKIINELEDCGIMNVTLTGGEPLIRSDFLDIVDALRERNIRIHQIYSNGSLVNKRLLTELDNRNIHPEFSMSFDGVGCHDWLRGITGAERLVDNAFALCRDMGFKTSCEMTLHRGNMHTIRDSINHLAGLGVRAVKVTPAIEKGEWNRNVLNIRNILIL